MFQSLIQINSLWETILHRLPFYGFKLYNLVIDPFTQLPISADVLDPDTKLPLGFHFVFARYRSFDKEMAERLFDWKPVFKDVPCWPSTPMQNLSNMMPKI